MTTARVVDFFDDLRVIGGDVVDGMRFVVEAHAVNGESRSAAVVRVVLVVGRVDAIRRDWRIAREEHDDRRIEFVVRVADARGVQFGSGNLITTNAS